MTSLQVRYFLHLCGTKSISETARQLFVAQPAVSKQIAALERELGTELFVRTNRGVELTYLSEPTAQLIRKMDLSAVAEFKRNGNGTVEVKFVDRVKALSALYDMLGGGDADEAAEFLQALEQAGEEKDDWRA